ncbi:unnamed protein product [Adineta ricciae]|uniref:Uncharacterized protein n=1 Tax=Adineta ricciae TaxID=249248 RepID=A0A815SKV9_ADIRI|nr:unnamed protein product [Adineta ricciae]CAF1493271.1 unnamed protein product [Adineta ricciae]
MSDPEFSWINVKDDVNWNTGSERDASCETSNRRGEGWSTDSDVEVLNVGVDVGVELLKAKTGCGNGLGTLTLTGPSAGVDAGLKSGVRETGLSAMAELSAVKGEVTLGPLYVSAGLNANTGVKAGTGGVQANVLGFGFTFGVGGRWTIDTPFGSGGFGGPSASPVRVPAQSQELCEGQMLMRKITQHTPTSLSPDDLWLMITIYFSKYVNSNSEQLRNLFVDHDGKKKLVVVEPVGKREEDWRDFFGKMQIQISKNVKSSEIVDNLINNFSTTTEIELVLSYACIMDTFQSYFEYSRCIPGCGIRNVHFQGTLFDWKLLKEKTEQLMSLTIRNDSFFQYLQNLIPILNEFIETYQGNVNVEFWNHIVDAKRGRLRSGSAEYLNGWILKLFYDIEETNRDKITSSDIHLNSIQVPVQVENYSTGLKKTCYVLGGFHGIDSTKDHIYKPVLSLVVIEDLTTVEKL